MVSKTIILEGLKRFHHMSNTYFTKVIQMWSHCSRLTRERNGSDQHRDRHTHPKRLMSIFLISIIGLLEKSLEEYLRQIFFIIFTFWVQMKP